MALSSAGSMLRFKPGSDHPLEKCLLTYPASAVVGIRVLIHGSWVGLVFDSGKHPFARFVTL